MTEFPILPAVNSINTTLPRTDKRNMTAQSIGTAQIHDLAVTNAKIKDLQADKITAGTITVGVNIGNSNIFIDGENANGGRIIFYTNGVPVIVIGSPT